MHASPGTVFFKLVKIWTSCLKNGLGTFLRPNISFIWLIATTIAAADTNPFITGIETKRTTKPSLNMPRTDSTIPDKNDKVDAIKGELAKLMYCLVIRAKMTVGPTLTSLADPNNA